MSLGKRGFTCRKAWAVRPEKAGSNPALAIMAKQQHETTLEEKTMCVLKFKPEPEVPVFTADLYYDLFEGGYIKPEAMLEPEDAERVREAMRLVEAFLDAAQDKYHIEVG